MERTLSNIEIDVYSLFQNNRYPCSARNRFTREKMNCLTWIQDLWKQLSQESYKGSETSILTLPDEIIMDILNRLPADTVLSCRIAHSYLLQLSSTPLFTENYFTSAAHILIAQDRSEFNGPMEPVGLFILEDVQTKNPRLKEVRMKDLVLMNTHYWWDQYELYASCNGFLLFLTGSISDVSGVIYNPLTREEIYFCEEKHTIICGFFFHRLEREYKLLLLSAEGTLGYYCLYGINTKVKREVGYSDYTPLLGEEHKLGVEVCGCLFWIVLNFRSECSKSIMIFNLSTETFNVVAHPGSSCTRSFYARPDPFHFEATQLHTPHDQMRLLETGGRLTLVNVCEEIVDVWVLEDLANWIWVKRYVVDLDHRFDHTAIVGHPVVAIEEGNLLLNWPKRGLFLCNLYSNHIRKFRGASNTTTRACDFYATRYTPNFSSNVFYHT